MITVTMESLFIPVVGYCGLYKLSDTKTFMIVLDRLSLVLVMPHPLRDGRRLDFRASPRPATTDQIVVRRLRDARRLDAQMSLQYVPADTLLPRQLRDARRLDAPTSPPPVAASPVLRHLHDTRRLGPRASPAPAARDPVVVHAKRMAGEAHLAACVAEATSALEAVRASEAAATAKAAAAVCGMVLRGRCDFVYWCGDADRVSDAVLQQASWMAYKTALLEGHRVVPGLDLREVRELWSDRVEKNDYAISDWAEYLEALAEVLPRGTPEDVPQWYSYLFPEAAPHMPPSRRVPPASAECERRYAVAREEAAQRNPLDRWPLALADYQRHVWEEYGGREVDEMMNKGTVALIDAHWLVAFFERGGRLRRRQELPDDAFITPAELVAAGCPNGLLPILVLCWMWTSAEEPDSDGRQQRILATVLKACTAASPALLGNHGASSCGPAATQRWGLFIECAPAQWPSCPLPRIHPVPSSCACVCVCVCVLPP